MPLRHPFRDRNDDQNAPRRRADRQTNKKSSKRKAGFFLSRDVEALEPRRLLTTFTGGDTFEYQDINSAINRIQFTGSITAEVVGASVDKGTNQLSVVDLPGNLIRNGQFIPINGGISTPQGVQIIGNVVINTTGPAGIAALASDSSGQLWGANVFVPKNQTGNNGPAQPNLLQIVQIDSRGGLATEVAEIHAQALALAGTRFFGSNAQITGATAAAFNPIDGKFYFVVTGGAGNTSVLFSCNVSSGGISNLTAIGGTFQNSSVGAIVFDQTGPNSARMLAAMNLGAFTIIANVNYGNTDAWTEQNTVNAGGNPIVGLSIRYDNPNVEDNILYGLTGQTVNGGGGGGIGANNIASGNVVQITLNAFGNVNGFAYITAFGPLNTQTIVLGQNGQNNNGGTIESNPGDLTFDPTMIDPFTGQAGALVGTDLTTHDLYIVSPNNRTPTTTLYQIYVVGAQYNSGISVATTPRPPAGVRPMLPFSGTIGSVRIRGTPNEVTAPQNSGAVLLGAKTVQLPNNNNSGDIPILDATLDRPHGVMPGGVGTVIHPGLVVAPGQVLGKFLFGGTVMGQVIIHGSIDQFYAGWLLTGDASTGLRSDLDALNFEVDGDLRNMYVLGPIGTDPSYGSNQQSSLAGFTPGSPSTGSSGNAPGLDSPTYMTDFNMYVGGSLGQIKAGGSIIGYIQVGHSATTATPTIGQIQREAEYIPTPAEQRGDNSIGAFDDMEMGGNALFTNDTLATAEFIGSLPTAVNGPNSDVLVQGQLQALPRQDDYVDYYGVALMAGQSITVQNTETTLQGVPVSTVGVAGDLVVGVFDPDGRLIMTDYNDVNPALTQGKPFRFTATLAGIYRFAVAEVGNPKFLPNTGGVLADFGYTLNIQNVGDLAIGGIVTYSSFLNQGTAAYRGDLGAIEVSGTTVGSISATMPPGVLAEYSPISVPIGNLRAIEAGSVGIGADVSRRDGSSGSGILFAEAAQATTTTTTQTTPTTTLPGLTGPTRLSFTGNTEYDLYVPNGGIGFLNAIGNAANNLLYIDTVTLQPATSLGLGSQVQAYVPGPVGGDIQMLNSAGTFAGTIETNKGLGTLRCEDINSGVVPTIIKVDADQKGEDGTIDLIDCLGDFGDNTVGGPQISTGPGGDVRYIKVGGEVYRDPTFGGSDVNGLGALNDQQTIYNPGVGTTIVDDSGSLIHIDPIGTIPNGAYVPGTLDANSPAFFQYLPAQLYILTYPIEGTGGSVVLSVISTGSVNITSTGDVPGQVAEISSIHIWSPGTAVTSTTAVTPQQTGVGTGIFKKPKHPRTPQGGVPGSNGTTTTTVTTAGGTTTVTTTTTGTTGTGTTGTGGTGTTGTGTTGTGTTTTPATPGSADQVAGAVNLYPTPSPTAGPGGATGLQQVAAAGSTPLFVHISGPGTVDVLNIVVINSNLYIPVFTGVITTPGTPPPTFGSATEITNTTGGELVSITAQSVGRIYSTGTVGLAKHHTAAATEPMQVLTAGAALDRSEERPVDPDLSTGKFFGNLYPFVQQRIGVLLMQGNLLSITAQSIGNLLVDGSIGEVIATGTQPGQGILGSVVAYNLQPTNRLSIAAAPNAGNIDTVQIGGGIAPTGSGLVGFAGIFADGRIGTVSGTNADIRGDIISEGGFDAIRLKNGSIINADIAATGQGAPVGGWAEHEAVSRSFLSFPTGPLDAPPLDIGSITVTGNGGIVGSVIAGDHAGTIAVNGGFGIFNSQIEMDTNGTIDRISADGYGIRNTFIDAGISLGQVIATGNGQQIPTSSFSPDVRFSETQQYDTYFDFQPNYLTDIDTYLGTTAANPLNVAKTDAGVIESMYLVGSRDLGNVRAYHFRGPAAGQGLTATPIGAPIGVGGITGPVGNIIAPLIFADQINFGNSIGTITSTSSVDGLGIITGKINNFALGSDASNLDLELAGRITNLTINGNLNKNSLIFARGSNGNIGTIHIRGSLDGTIKAQRKIGTVLVDGTLTGSVDAPNITKIQAGSLQSGTLTINGNLQNLISLGDLGTNGQSILIHGTVGTIKVAGNMNTNATIQGNLRLLKVGGSITSGTTIYTVSTLNSLQVGGDIQQNATVKAHFIRSKKIKGQVLGSVITGV